MSENDQNEPKPLSEIIAEREEKDANVETDTNGPSAAASDDDKGGSESDDEEAIPEESFSEPLQLVPADSYRAEPDGYIGPAHNAGGYRNIVANTRGQLTVLDDDTARMFSEQPNFYHYIYDDGTKDSAHVSMFRWADPAGRTYEAIGQFYPVGE